MNTRTNKIGLLLVAWQIAWTMCIEFDEGKGKDECKSYHHVCTTLMKYPDGYIANEGPYCSCVGTSCGSSFSNDDGRVFTWQHYERGHWLVQYRFCQTIRDDSKPECDPDELAAVIMTPLGEWKPYISDARCRCENGIHQLERWKREGDVWKYYYYCHKKTCDDLENKACATITMDVKRPADKVKEVQFHCACPKDYMCPAKVKDEDNEQRQTKTVLCEPIKQVHKKTK